MAGSGYLVIDQIVNFARIAQRLRRDAHAQATTRYRYPIRPAQAASAPRGGRCHDGRVGQGRAQPQVSGSAGTNGRHSRRTARDDSSLTPHRTRASRGTERKAITVALRTLATWDAGFQGQVTITNHTARPVKGWTLILSYPQTKILSAWNVKIIRTGATLVADNPAGHPSIAPGKSVKVTFNADGSGAEPATCSFNGSPC